MDEYTPNRRPSGGYYRDVPRGPAADERRSSYREDRYSNYDRDDDRSYRQSYGRRSPPPYRDSRSHRSYRDRDREDSRRSRSSSPDDRYRNRSPGRPSREVIMRGLPEGMRESQVQKQLEHFCSPRDIDDIRVIRERGTDISKQFGFVSFRDLETAKRFMNQNFPSIIFRGSRNDDDTTIRISFSRDRQERDRMPADGEWQCPECQTYNRSYRDECIKCRAPYSLDEFEGAPAPAPYTNVGDSDVAPDFHPSHFLILRGLDSSVTEEVLAKGVAKLLKETSSEAKRPSSSGKGSSTLSSTASADKKGAPENSLRRVFLIRDRETRRSWGFGFAEFLTIEDAQAATNKYKLLDKFTISSKSVMVDFIHSGVFIPAWDDVRGFSFAALRNPSLHLVYWDQHAYVAELGIATDALPDMARNDEKKSKKDVNAADGQRKKRKTGDTWNEPMKRLNMADHLQHWAKKHAEIHGTDKPPEPNVPAPETATTKEPRVSYVDLDEKCCYLCSRKFQEADTIVEHERASELHKTNLQDEKLIAKARAKMVKKGLLSGSQPESTPAYRDRAKERRQAHNQPKQPGFKGQGVPRGGAKTAARTNNAKDADNDTEASKPSKGANLLGKMGWSAGQGLGARGEGSKEALQTNLYAAGVGLGAAGSKVGDAAEEATRRTINKQDDFVQRTKETAKKRFAEL